MHKLLSRLIRRNLSDGYDQQEFQKLFDEISLALAAQDDERLMLERSVMLVSDELNEINKELRQKLVENKGNQQQLEEALVKQKALLDATPEAIFSFKSSGQLDQINRSACEIFDLDEAFFENYSPKEALKLFADKLLNPKAFLSEIHRIKKDNTLELHGFMATRDGRHFEYVSHPEIMDDVYIGRVWCYRDITDIRKNQALLQHHAYHDSLTDLPNRNLLIETLESFIRKAKVTKKEVAVVFIDLDDFKKINDTSGHEEGDRCLIEVSHRLKKAVGKNDILGRLGGDEFLLIMDHVEDKKRISDVSERILSLFGKFFKVGDLTYSLSASIGISFYPQDGSTPEELIRKSDMAMYKAKQKGKNTYYFYDHSIELQALHRVSIEHQLREAIKSKELVLYYQPKVCLLTGNIQGLEALIRWFLPNGDVMYPDSFIAIAESTGLIRNITQWVLETVCEKMIAWKGSALENTPVSINITAIDFSDREFLDSVFKTIDHYKIDPSLLEFELTESVFFDDIKWVKNTISKLKARSIRLSIDDFGTGYSSFGYLQDLDIDYLKIDRSFVQGLHHSARSLSIVKSIIDIGTNLDLEVIAEGVEGEKELECLLKAGCHYGQGYYFSKPVSEAAILDYIIRMPNQARLPLTDNDAHCGGKL